MIGRRVATLTKPAPLTKRDQGEHAYRSIFLDNLHDSQTLDGIL
jgi:hypothetical protein